MQGPPGTGKSTAIVGIVAALVARNASSLRADVSGSIPEVKVLVCAQSNAAVDELVLRLAESDLHFATDGSKRWCT